MEPAEDPSACFRNIKETFSLKEATLFDDSSSRMATVKRHHLGPPDPPWPSGGQGDNLGSVGGTNNEQGTAVS